MREMRRLENASLERETRQSNNKRELGNGKLT